MLTLHLTPDDLAAIRFAYSPLIELATSYRVLDKSSHHTLYRPWVEETKQALHDIDLPYMQALIVTSHYIPDFLTPTPLANQNNIDEMFRALLETPTDLILKNVQFLSEVAGMTEIRQQFLVYPRETLYCLVEELRLYWQRALARHWPQMTGTLDGDILYRARRLALEGTSALFEDIDLSLSYQPGEIRLEKAKPYCTEPDLYLDGSGIQLVPAIFAPQKVMWQIEPDWRTMLLYSARGAGLWWRKAQEMSERNRSLELALGAGRAQVLYVLLKSPLSTGELAHRLHISSGAASQHLSRLSQAGLVQAQRSGKRVYYQLTRRGSDLVGLFS